MKKFGLIVLLAAYLITATELRELLKLPVMLEHYTEHKQKDNTITFFGFLCMHYNDAQHDDKSHEHERKLPFKSCSHCSANLAFLFTGLHHPSYCLQPLEMAANTFSFKHLLIKPTAFQGNIWQPPRLG